MASQNIQNVLILTDGEKLKILLLRDGRSLDDILSVWGRTRSQISRYQKMKNLPRDVIGKACDVLGVPESLFDRRLDADSLLKELASLRSDIDRLNERVQNLETEKLGLLSIIRGAN